MSDVHIQVLRACIEGVRRWHPDFDVEAVIDRFEVREPLASGARVPWSTIAGFVAALREHVGGREGMFEFGRRTMREDLGEHPFRPLVRRVLTPRRLYRLAFGLRHRSNYPFLTLRLHEPRPGQLEIAITIPEPLVDSPGYFEVLTGQLESLPCLLGEPPATLELFDIGPREGYWRLLVPIRGRLRTRMLELLMWRRTRLRDELGLELDLLERQHQRLRRAYAELEAETGRRERAEQDRRELERLLLHQQRLELVGHLTGGIAHDFNNVLQVIAGSCELLELELRPAPGSLATERLAEIDQALASAHDLTRQLLGFSRARSQTDGPVELGPAIAKIARMLRRVLPRAVALECGEVPGSLWVPLEPVELEQLLINLVVNARDAMPDGGAIELRVAAVPGSDPGRVRIEVRDDGVGIDAATRARMFEPFFTTKPEARGTGLGLAIVCGLVERHAGTIAVDSTPGHGTCFAIELPLTDPTWASA